jgi:DNA invertase Pin-like site-specific DNA recombinase
MLERQREGVAKAKTEGKYKGRKPTARAKSEDVIAKFKANQRPADIAKSVGIGRASVYRILSGAGLV